MTQTQQPGLSQRHSQRLSLSRQMHLSLDVLQKGPERLAEALRAEARRNPFLRFAATGGLGRPDLPPVVAQASPREGIRRQIGLMKLSPQERRLGEDLVHCLDDRGFLPDPPDRICADLDVAPAMLARVVERLQDALDPAGVFAWSLKDAFRLQLQAANRYDALIARLLDRLDLVARADIAGIQTACGVDREDAEDMLREIRGLSPAPLIPEPPPLAPARPPELVFSLQGGQATAALNPDALPALLTDDGLFDTVAAVETEGPALAYYRACYQGAAQLVLALQRRANTLLRIGQAMAQAQSRFVRSGRPQDRRPLSMAGLARDLGLHRSTVSRALAACRIQTAHGVMDASSFILPPLSEGAEDRTRDQALRRLSVILRTEDRHRPYSDQALAAFLAQARLPVSRRTVAKYRALLGVPGAYARRRGASLDASRLAQNSVEARA
ncbi:MAG: RNA polymerase subunit sigma-54 [Pseudomonadota bacterium]